MRPFGSSDTGNKLATIDLQRNRRGLGAVENPRDHALTAQAFGFPFTPDFTTLRFDFNCFHAAMPPRGEALASQTNSELIDSSSCVRRIASAIRRATDNTLILLHASASTFKGTEFVTTSSSIADSLILRSAKPDRTACVQHPMILFAPSFWSASAAIVSVPAVSTISSTRTATCP